VIREVVDASSAAVDVVVEAVVVVASEAEDGRREEEVEFAEAAAREEATEAARTEEREMAIPARGERESVLLLVSPITVEQQLNLKGRKKHWTRLVMRRRSSLGLFNLRSESGVDGDVRSALVSSSFSSSAALLKSESFVTLPNSRFLPLCEEEEPPVPVVAAKPRRRGRRGSRRS
jgi:hypothetical protein